MIRQCLRGPVHTPGPEYMAAVRYPRARGSVTARIATVIFYKIGVATRC